MFYRKNIGGLNSISRIVAGCLMISCGWLGLHLSPLGWLIAGTGLFSILSGVFGYCPACAIAGRKSSGN